MEPARICPVCHKQQAQVLFWPRSSPGPVSKCQCCGMVYIATIEDNHALIFDGPVKSAELESIALTSSNLADIRNAWELKLLAEKEVAWPALRQNAIHALQRIERHINEPITNGKLLDFGSGWGFFLSVAKEQGWSAYGLEPLLASSVYARATFGLDIKTDTLRADTFPQDFFDVITSFQVFEHLPDPADVLQHLHKMLRPNGIILIEVPNFETWTMRLMGSRHRHFVQDHLNFFSMETLGKLLANSGFVLLDQFHPTRKMSFHHLNDRWFRKFLPAWIANSIQRSLQSMNLWERIIGINIGDIIAVVARKL